jgi:hypothetical protein
LHGRLFPTTRNDDDDEEHDADDEEDWDMTLNTLRAGHYELRSRAGSPNPTHSMRARVKSLDRSSRFLYIHPNPPMKRAIDCPAAYSYSTVAFNVLPEMTTWDCLASDEGVQNKQITDGFYPSQG